MKRTILLADDSSTIQRLVAQTLDGDDFSVVAVSNGDAAIRKFDELRPAAVLADIFMPGKNGYEVCAFVREHAVLDRTPVILLVGAFEAYDEDEAARVGASGRITKPFEPQELLDLVSSALEDGPRTDYAAEPGDDPDDRMDADILGLEDLFPRLEETPRRVALTEDEIEQIADRVIARLSTEVIEGIAWDIVPDIAERIVREELGAEGAGDAGSGSDVLDRIEERRVEESR